ncbi:MAG: hypothetical protein ACP5N3_04660 [Candidatus Nanoarchaeia archaeon]
MRKAAGWKFEAALLAAILIAAALFLFQEVSAAPTGVNITYNQTETPNATPASSLTTAGGSFTTMVLNGTFQNYKWKAYVGNVTGVLTLDDASGYTIYDWNLTSISGEVYVSRASSLAWAYVNCSNTTLINSEQTFLNFNASKIDSINNTFSSTIHKGFYVGTRQITNSTCKSTSTYVNDTRQGSSESAKFQEVLLTDNTNLIYAVILEDNVLGFDNSPYDFQLIVAEDETKTIPTTYYFYAEIS